MGINSIMDAAKAELKKDESIRPKIIAIKDGNATMMFLEFEDKKQKEIMRQIVTKQLKAMQPDEYYFISEAWISRQRDDRVYREPRRDIDRMEAIMVMEYHREMDKCKVSQMMFKKVDGKYEFEDVFTDKLQYAGSAWDIWHEQDNLVKGHDQKVFRKWAKEIKAELYPELQAAKTDEQRAALLKKTIQRCHEKFKEQQKTILEDTDGEEGGR